MPPPVVLSDGARKVQLHMRTVKKNLDEAIFGHDHAKQRVLQLACQWVTNPKSQTQVVGVVGPPGNGKTTLVREGIARALGRPLVQISLGGAKDSSILEGHSFTYVGAQCGRIASALQEARVMNPLLYLDELDKVSETHHGAEIIGVLTHLTDPAQNAVFADNYFAGIPLDLSRSLLVFSFNDEAKINPVLRDRLTVIRVKGFNVEEKIRIAQDYLLPRLLEKVGLTKGDVMVEADAVSWIVHQLPDQEGVRGLLHALESAIIQMNFVRLMQEAREEEENAAASAEKTEGTPEREGVADAEETDENANKSGVSPSEGETGRSGEKEGNGELGDDVREGKSPAAPPPSLPVSSNKEEDEGKEGKAPGWEGGGFSPFPAPAAAAKETEAAETPPADLSLRGAPAARDSVEFFPDGEGGVLKEMKEKESVEKVEREKSGIIDAGENGKDEVAAVSAGGTETGRSPARDSDSGRMRENEQIESPKLTKGTQEGSSVSPAEDPNDTTEKEKAKNEEESPSPQDKKDQPEGSPPPLSLEPRDALDVSCEKRGDEREQQNTEEQNRQNPLRLPLERRPLAKLNAADDEDTGGQASETPREVSPLSPFPSAPQERGIALEGLSVGVAGEEAQEGEESPVIVVLDPEDDLVDVEGGGENTDGDEKERESERKSSSDPHSAASPQTQRPAGSPSTFVSVSRADEEDPDALAAGGAADASPSPSDSPSASADSPVGGDLCQPVPPTSFVVSGDPFLADCSSEKEKEKEQEKERSAVQGDGGGDVKPDPSVRSPPVHPSQGVDCLPSGVGGDLPPSPSSSAVAMGPPLLSLSASTLDKSGDSMGVVEGGGGGAEGKAASTEGQPPEKGETVMEGGGKETEKGRSVQISLNHHGSGCGDGEAEAEGGVGDKGKGEGQEGAKGGEKPEEGTGEGPATAAAECAAEKGGEAEDSADNSKKEAEGGDGGDDGGANSAGGKGGKRRRRGVAMIDRKDEFGISLSWPRIVLPFVITREWMERLATIEEVAGGPPPGMYL
uniref:ATPase AAA-type core domain-containing protein n=1 Tax=Chromera velia CCMP2878 TaxID=1169474 RepID=A0A0G4HF85_9ALVE|eukprot:Cvel_6590.t1-p1 / transcript=Cvel_6590.t1 / gene=Cvel_6590 / organism=Chromera_velia_CCMP2878 / gene_product=Lon protease homolog, putative / transcript_product=Lon protease homolog, putative / location=Cvel_scaffold325:53544-60986(+) / protein_length=1020 / sequence_SO=supercontig / SO=protein_coding / is_pseudo=false